MNAKLRQRNLRLKRRATGTEVYPHYRFVISARMARMWYGFGFNLEMEP